MKRLLVLFIVILFTSVNSNSQDKAKIKFGNVTAEDFKPTAYGVDSSASAVVIADIGSTEIVGNNTASFSLLFKRFRRARVLNKSGYDIGNIEIGLYSNGDAEEELENLKAVCYNLENGKVIETKLEGKSAIFTDKINKNLVIKKFTFPNMKEGSIIEFEYKIKSDFIFNLQPWEFQGEYPCLWSEYNVAMPSFYSYVTLTQGYHPYLIKDVKQSRSNFNMADIRTTGATERASFTALVTDFRWVMKDIPALKEESYTSTLSNHISRIEFQLSSIGEPFQYQKVMASWDMVAKELMEDEDFGAQLKKDNGWLNDVIDQAVNKATTELDKTRNIFAWVRDNFTCTNYNRKYLDQPLKNVLKAKPGMSQKSI
ncbi:MAG: hypothetical protein ACXWCG_09530 [Flavitalea sp.]